MTGELTSPLWHVIIKCRNDDVGIISINKNFSVKTLLSFQNEKSDLQRKKLLLRLRDTVIKSVNTVFASKIGENISKTIKAQNDSYITKSHGNIKYVHITTLSNCSCRVHLLNETSSRKLSYPSSVQTSSYSYALVLHRKQPHLSPALLSFYFRYLTLVISPIMCPPPIFPFIHMSQYTPSICQSSQHDLSTTTPRDPAMSHRPPQTTPSAPAYMYHSTKTELLLTSLVVTLEKSDQAPCTSVISAVIKILIKDDFDISLFKRNITDVEECRPISALFVRSIRNEQS